MEQEVYKYHMYEDTNFLYIEGLKLPFIPTLEALLTIRLHFSQLHIFHWDTPQLRSPLSVQVESNGWEAELGICLDRREERK